MSCVHFRKRRIYVLAITFSMVISLLGPAFLMAKVQAAVFQTWSDTFSDSSKIYSSTNVTQVTDISGFGTAFTPYSGNPLLTLETCDPWDANGNVSRQIPGAVHPDVIYFPQGMDGYKFWMMFTPLNGTSPPGWSGIPDDWWERYTLVRSNDGIHWVKTPDYTNPVINPAGWDANGNCDPDFVYVPGMGWFLYYCAGGSLIGVATSSDGLHYTKYVGPFGGAIIPSYSACPTVVYNETTGIFHMWFNWGSVSGQGALSYATSTDGLNWTPYNSDSPGTWGYIVFQSTPGTFDQGGISHTNVIYYQGQYWIYYLAKPTSAYAQLVIGLAKSSDGIHWTKYPSPVLTPGHETWKFTGDGTTVVGSLYHAAPVIVGDTMYMYYGGTDSSIGYAQPPPNYETGLAFSVPPDGHVELEKESFVSAEYPTRSGAMGWYHFNEGTAPSPNYPGEYQPVTQTSAWYHFNEGGPSVPTYPGEYAPKDHTLAWYHFNEGSGTIAGDSSGNNNNGTLDSTEPPTWTTGLYSYGLSFDGNDRVTMPDSASLNPAENITIEAWVNPSVDKGWNYIVCKMTPVGGDYSYGIYLDNSIMGYSEIQAFITSSSSLIAYYSYGGNIPLGTWTHIAMTYEMNSTADTHIKLYQNGNEVPIRKLDPGSIPAGTTIRANTGPLNVGVLPYTPSPTQFYYNGTMDEVRILDRPLSGDEIKADGEMIIPKVLDSSGNGNDGTLDAPTWMTGLYGYGLSFDGNDRVTIPYSASLNPTENITIEAWVNPSVHKGTNYLVCKMTPGGGDYSYGLYLDNSYGVSYSEIQAFIRPSSGDTELYAFGGNVPIGAWTHIAMTYEMNSTSPTHIKLYQNGVEVSYRTYDNIPAGTHIFTNTGPLNLGVLPISSPRYYIGIMDEVRVVGRALSADEIKADGDISAPEIVDSSGNGNHGSRVGEVSWTTGMFSYGLNFDGSTGYVSVPNSASLNPTENITIEAWVNPSVKKQNNYIVIKMTPHGADYSYGLSLENITGYLEIVPFIRHSSGGTEYYSYGGNVPVGTWTHIAVTYQINSTASTRIRIYQNGVEVTPRAYDSIPSGTYIPTNTGPLTIGCIPWVDYYRYYNGTMDELRILDRALSPSEIMADYGGYRYKSHGNLTSILITPGIAWDKFYATDEKPAGTSIQYSILNDIGTVLVPSINSGDSISSLGTTPVRLHAELSTSDPSTTPILHDWNVTYEVEPTPNTPPVASGLTLTPLAPYDTDNLVASYTYNDADGDLESGTEIRWYKDSVLQSSYNDTKTILSSSTAPGQVWYFTVKPKDGKDFGTLQTSPTVTIKSYIFNDGFETGSFSAWTGTAETPTVTSDQKYLGTYGAVMDTSNEYCYATFSSQTTVFARLYFQFTTLPPADYNNDVFAMLLGGSTNIWRIGVQNRAGNYRIILNRFYPSSTNSYYNFAFQTNTWYCFEIKFVKHPSAGEYRVWLDGVEVITNTGLNTGSAPNADQLRTGICASISPFIETNYIDCVVVDASYIGPEKLVDVTPPVYSSVGTNSTLADQPCKFFAKWTDDTGLSGCIFSTNNTGTWLNSTWTPLAGLSNWSNVTRTLNSTVAMLVEYRFYCNDTSNNWGSTPVQSLITTKLVTLPPVYSNVGANSTFAGEPCKFYAKWTDDTGLSGFIFSTNNTGTWVNDTWTPLGGFVGWSNVTKMLGSAIGVQVGYRFYCNDTSNNWSSTPIQSLITTQPVVVYHSSLSVLVSSSSALVGYKANIMGSLTYQHNGSGISNAPVWLYYSITGGQDWNLIASTTTSSDGSYFATWFTMHTGNFIIKAIYMGDSNIIGVETSVNLVITDIEEQVFSVSSNSTVSKLTFSSNTKEINFTVAGPMGTTGYMNIYLSKSLVSDTTGLKIYFDGVEKSYETVSVDDLWVIHLAYSHSTHSLRICLPSASPAYTMTELATKLTLVIGAALVAAATSLALFRRKKIRK